MNPEKLSLFTFENLPLISQKQINKRIQLGHKLLFYDQLIVDITEFRHPGQNKILEPFINNIQKNIKQNFLIYKHSQNSRLILLQNVIGKFQMKNYKNSQNNYATQRQQQSSSTSGKQLYEQIFSSKKLNFHAKAISKIDFSLPIYDQIQNKLSFEEKKIMTQIPKHFSKEEQIKFKQTYIKQLIYGNNFWTSTFSFQFMILFICYLISQQIQQNTISTKQWLINMLFLLFGLLKWTFIEYYFHRFLLHYEFNQKNQNIEHHLMHHSFPNKKNIIAITIHKVILYIIAFYFIYSYVIKLQKLSILFILVGVLIGLTLYDIIHYYCHFGPQIQLSILKKLKRNHLKHHFKDQNKGFGVSTTLWDRILGTSHIKLSEKINKKS